MQESTENVTVNTTNTLQNEPGYDMDAAEQKRNRKTAQRLLFDFLVIIIVIIPVIVCEFGIEPFRRGFFCDDETIRYPFHANTVTTVMLGLLVGLLPMMIIFIVEFVRFYRHGEKSATVLFLRWRVRIWLLESIKQTLYFTFGLLLIFDATEVGKYTIGRLRPHFIAVCQPQLLDGSTCADAQNRHRYVESYMCTGEDYTVDDVRQARLSFPSGHSSLTFYALVYVAIYMQYRLTWRGSKLYRHFLQFVLIMLAWFTALSRVMDNWHHWSDVLAGSAIGILGAILTARYIAKLYRVYVPSENLKLLITNGITRQDTNTTLQDVVISNNNTSTPPPYTIDTTTSLSTTHSFSNEQYCTKV